MTDARDPGPGTTPRERQGCVSRGGFRSAGVDPGGRGVAEPEENFWRFATVSSSSLAIPGHFVSFPHGDAGRGDGPGGREPSSAGMRDRRSWQASRPHVRKG